MKNKKGFTLVEIIVVLVILAILAAIAVPDVYKRQELGVSPRGVLALVQMAKAHAVLEDRIYVIPEDVQDVFLDVCAHRLLSLIHI